MKKESGQAMVEFVIFLIVIMALCIGMLTVSRLLSFQFWAQQDARYLAYEQTWAAQEYYNNSGEQPLDLHDQGLDYGGPKQLPRIDSTRKVDEGTSASSIIAWLFQEEVNPLEKTKEQLELVNTAYARSEEKNSFSKLLKLKNVEISTNEKIEKAKEFLEKAEFGKRACRSLRSFEAQKQIGLMKAFDDCESEINDNFAKRIASNFNIKVFFEQINQRIKNGVEPKKAIRDTILLEATEQYFSLFDNKVKQAMLDSNAELTQDVINAENSFNDPSVNKMIKEARYRSSADAVQGVIDVSIGLSDPDNPNAAREEREHAVNIGSYLFNEAEEEFDDTAYDFNLSYLPVPWSFGKEGIQMQESVMSNILGGFTEPGFSPDDDDLRDSVIKKSARGVEVNYKAKGGLFPAAATWLSSSTNVQLTARHFLITQPWHITRRNGLGAYRSKGTQMDNVDDPTEEGLLKRRTFGLWVYPSELTELLSPILGMVGLGDIGSAMEELEPFDDVLNETKKQLVKNPFRTLVDALNQIPVIDQMVPDLPEFPAVRPDAYPKSKELEGNSPGSPDRMVQGKDRKFKDYIEEQRTINPKPNPTYN